MKKIILLLLIGFIPFLSNAQKRSKKGDKSSSKFSEAKYEFMTIKGYEIAIDGNAANSRGNANQEGLQKGPEEVLSPDMQLKKLMMSNQKVIINFDFGLDRPNEESVELNKNSRQYRSMVTAVNAAAARGWEFHSSDIIVVGTTRVHYYYMRRDK